MTTGLTHGLADVTDSNSSKAEDSFISILLSNCCNLKQEILV